jgi:transposase
MDHPTIFSATLGLSHPWHIVTVTFAREESRMDISLDYYLGNLFTCPRCGEEKAPCSAEEETWFHEDFFRFPTYLHARVPRIECCQGVVATERPWSRAGSKFGRVQETGESANDASQQGADPSALRSTTEQRRWRQHPG